MTFDDMNDNKMGWKHLLDWVGKALLSLLLYMHLQI